MKLVKARCTKTNKPLVLQVSDDGKQVMGFFKTDEHSYNAMSSQVRISGATVKTGGGFVPFGSDEGRFRSTRCNSSTAFDRECLVCPHLKPVYTKGEGGCIQLKAGEVAAIELSRLKVGCNWDTRCDIDSSVILAGRGVKELVYFGHKDDEAGCIHHRGDNLTGEAGAVPGTEDDENIDVYLDRVPARFDRIIFVINIYSGATNFSNVRGLKLTIYDQETDEKLISYDVEQNFARKQSLVIGEARRSGSEWEFKAIGEGTNYADLDSLTEYCVSKHW